MSPVRVPVPDATELAERILGAAGLPDEASRMVADNLVDADRRGITSHGLVRLPIYVQRLGAGVVDATARPTVREHGARASVDGHNAMGAVVADAGMRAACGLADRYGVGVSVARRSNHSGTMGFYARRAAERGHLAMAMSNAPPTMAYHGGRDAAVGTNPVAIAVPRPAGPPVVLDVASSAVARGKILVAEGDGGTIPLGWALDAQGRPTTDATEALRGAMVPFAGPKGSGLALVIDLLCGVFAGAASGAGIGNMYDDWDRPQDVGHAFLAVEASGVLQRSGGALEEFLAWVGERTPGDGFDAVQLPGEPEERAARAADELGVPLGEATWRALGELAAAWSIPLPVPPTPVAD